MIGHGHQPRPGAPPLIQSWPGVVVVTGPALRTAADAMLIAARSRRLSGLPRSALHDQLAEAFIAASAIGHMDVPDVVVPESLPEVSVEEAAKRMKKSHRQVRRLAPKLGGRIIGGRWMLDRHAIEEHCEGTQL